MDDKKHHYRLAAVLAIAVVAIFTIAVSQFVESGEGQNAAVLRAFSASE